MTLSMKIAAMPLLRAMLAAGTTACLLTVPAHSQEKAPKGPKTSQPVLVDAIIAVVNSDVITLKELDERMRLVEQRMKRQNMQPPPRDLLQKQLLKHSRWSMKSSIIKTRGKYDRCRTRH